VGGEKRAKANLARSLDAPPTPVLPQQIDVLSRNRLRWNSLAMHKLSNDNYPFDTELE